MSIIVDENELKLVGDIEINFKDIQDFYSHYQIIEIIEKILNKLLQILFLALIMVCLNLMN